MGDQEIDRYVYIQFSGIGDISFGSYLFHALRIIGMTGILGNGFVLIVLIKRKCSPCGVMEALLINQSLVDLMTATTLLISAHVHVPKNYISISLKNELICRIFRTQMPLISFFSTSVYNLVAISLEQYVQITHPIFYHNHVKNMKARFFIGSVWIVGLSFNLLLTLPTSGIVTINVDKNYTDFYDRDNATMNSSIFYVCSEQEYNLSETSRHIKGLFAAVTYYFLPFLVIFYALICMVIQLHKQQNRAGPLCRTSMYRSMKISMIKTMSLFCVVFIACWSLNSFIHILASYNLFAASFYTSTFYSVSLAIFYGCCATNPLLYIVSNRKLRSAVRNVFSSCKLFSNKNVISIAVIELRSNIS